MKWAELSNDISCVMNNTPLGQIIEIRSENDKDRLKNFTPEQLRIRRDWRNKQAKNVGENDFKAFLEQMEKGLIAMAGGNDRNEGC